MAETTLHEGMAEQRRRREEAERERDDLRRQLYARREPRESPETVEAAPERAEPPLREALRRAYGGHGGGEYSEDRRSMQDDQTAKDATRLLEAFSANHLEARMVSPYGLDRPFSPSWADAEQAGLDRVRRDAAMSWLIDNNLLEREETENLRGQGEGLPDYDYVYGSVFTISDPGRELLEEICEDRRQQ